MNKEILLAGFGGQGILFAGKVLAYCGLMDKKELSWLPSYGPEMRGGTANCSVCISDEPIASPLVTEPDLMMAMNQPSFEKFINKVKAGGKAFIDSTLVINGTANIILIGKMIKESGLFSFETIKKALEKCIPPKRSNLLGINLRAIEIGMSV